MPDHWDTFYQTATQILLFLHQSMQIFNASSMVVFLLETSRKRGQYEFFESLELILLFQNAENGGRARISEKSVTK